jgi:tRNA A-37 threonylcarbamoyl transferase component Bud32
MGSEGILIIDGNVVLKATDGIQHHVNIDTISARVTKTYRDRIDLGISAKECMENEIKFLDYCKKYDFVPKLLSVNADTLAITTEYAGESIWDYGRESGDPTRRSYLFAVKFKYRNTNIRNQITRIIKTLLLDEGIYTEFFINNFVVNIKNRVCYVDFDKAKWFSQSPDYAKKLEANYRWWEERWNYWIPIL